MSRDSQRPRKTFSKGGSSDFNKRKSFSSSDKPKRDFKSGGSSFKKRDGDSTEKRSYTKREGGFEGGEKKSYSSEKRPFGQRQDGSFRSKSTKSFGDREKRSYGSKSDSFEKKPYTKREDGKYESSDRKPYGDREKKSYGSKSDSYERKPYTKREDGKYESKFAGKKYDNKEKKSYGNDEFGGSDRSSYERKPRPSSKTESKPKKAGPKKTSNQPNVSDDAVRLNRYLANAGICSRREADVLIATGVVTVNGKIITEMGYKVNPTDVVTYGGVPIKNETKKYLVLNKPKDYITTMDDPQERRTVMELVRHACKERLYPVGRLDRNTTGILLFTNDGDLTAKLTHPKFEVRKVYHVTLNKKMTTEDYRMLNEGLELADGFIKPDAAEFVGTGKTELGVEIHSGKNRIVRRMFEHLGYEVIKLDRVAFAGLTKKDLQRGKFRFLTEKEVSFLKMLG